MEYLLKLDKKIKFYVSCKTLDFEHKVICVELDSNNTILDLKILAINMLYSKIKEKKSLQNLKLMFRNLIDLTLKENMKIKDVFDCYKDITGLELVYNNSLNNNNKIKSNKLIINSNIFENKLNDCDNNKVVKYKSNKLPDVNTEYLKNLNLNVLIKESNNNNTKYKTEVKKLKKVKLVKDYNSSYKIKSMQINTIINSANILCNCRRNIVKVYCRTCGEFICIKCRQEVSVYI